MDGNINTFNKQRGAALVVCLIVLLVMSVIGVTSVSNSTIQQRMASNLRQQQLAENAAEAALRRAENDLRGLIVTLGSVATFADSANGRYVSQRDNELQLPLSVHALGDITDPDNWGDGNSFEVTNLSSEVVGANNPRYIIEYIGRSDPPNIGRNSEVSSLSGNPPEYIHFSFRITSIGWGVDPNAYAVLQSTFRSSDFIVSQ